MTDRSEQRLVARFHTRRKECLASPRPNKQSVPMARLHEKDRAVSNSAMIEHSMGRSVDPC